MPPTLSWKGVGLTDIGRVRKLNQDAFSMDSLHQLWVLADGMGGHAGGEVASQMAVELIPEFFRTHPEIMLSGPLQTATLEKILVHAIEAANKAIREKATQNPEIKGMGTTVVIVAITTTPDHSHAVIAHAGDSRAYVLRENTLALWTKDHTLMEDQLELNLITPEEVRTHPLRHVLTKGLGIGLQVLPTVNTYQLDPTDILLLCSDGLTKMLSDSEIQAVMRKGASNLENLSKTFILTANRLGGEDNTTVVVIGSDSDEN